MTRHRKTEPSIPGTAVFFLWFFLLLLSFATTSVTCHSDNNSNSSNSSRELSPTSTFAKNIECTLYLQDSSELREPANTVVSDDSSVVEEPRNNNGGTDTDDERIPERDADAAPRPSAGFVSEESWVCGDLRIVLGNGRGDGRNNNRNGYDYESFRSVAFAEIRSEDLDLQEYLESRGARSGTSRLRISEAKVSPKTAELFVPGDATIELDTVYASSSSSSTASIGNNNDSFSSSSSFRGDGRTAAEGGDGAGEATPRENPRGLAPARGTLRSLVVRIIGSDGKAPSTSKRTLYEDTFRSSDGRSMAQQYKGCSYGKVDIVPHAGIAAGNTNTNNSGDTPGVIDLKLGIPITEGISRSVVANEGTNRLREYLEQHEGGSYTMDDLDLVHFCIPAGTIVTNSDARENWLAYAYMNSKFSFANDHNGWCRSVSVKIHEVGHNMGLDHSGRDKPANDRTDLMGHSYSEDQESGGFQRMCFNAAKNFQLQWYKNQQKSDDPFQYTGPSFSKTYPVIGVSDYSPNGSKSDGLVVLRLNNYYIGYNRKKGINDGVQDEADKIVIVRKNKGGPLDVGTSTMVATLGYGQSHTIQGFQNNNNNNNNNEGKDVTIRFVGLSGEGVATIEVVDDSRAPQPDEDNENNNVPGSCSKKGLFELSVSILGDNYPGDIYWSIVDTDNNGMTVHFEDSYEARWDETDVPDTRIACLPHDTNFEFVISDRMSDGICCSYGSGYYRGVGGDDGIVYFVGGRLEEEGHQFYGSGETRAFRTPSPISQEEDDDEEPPQYIIDDCSDNPRFKYQNNKNKNCEWIGNKGAGQRKKICRKTVRGTKVKISCPTACIEKCMPKPFCKNKTAAFKINGVSHKCKKIKKKDGLCNLKTDRGDRFGKGPKVKKKCPLVCTPQNCSNG